MNQKYTKEKKTVRIVHSPIAVNNGKYSGTLFDTSLSKKMLSIV
eukprot:CAMPEP_0169273710 /NCGR_PEP_ID=MMETSP1016-20121227/51268_1 /TAXON_ID=342587 /ORGANISM="Karlodinium micrum, Strain CCMP2283" /LENGTH=43 /DNA_ID= /DNA_START= /DNA_END= /DNA_ORIENTATION=